MTRITVEKDVSVLDSEREESRANLSRLQAAEDTMKRTETEALNFIHLLGNRYDLTAAVGGASAAGKVEASLEIGEKAHAIVQQQLKTRQQASGKYLHTSHVVNIGVSQFTLKNSILMQCPFSFSRSYPRSHNGTPT